MRSIVVVDINAPQKQVAALYADPGNNPKWMDDLERYEPLSGDQGTPGSTYRLIPKRGSMVFTATVVSRNLPDELRLRLDSSSATVDVHGTLSTLADGRTRLVSEEVFKFKGIWNSVFGLLARPAIRKAHRGHIEAFKRFAEPQPGSG
jgi:Polyketide cyclase / dehydrase and lipid transport